MVDPPQTPPIVRARPVEMRPPLLQRATAWCALPNLTARAASLDLLLVFMIAVLLEYLPGLVLAGAIGDVEQLVPNPLLLVFDKWADATLASVLLGYFVLRNGTRPDEFGLHLRNPLGQLGCAALTVVGLYALLLMTVVPISIYFTFSGPEAVEELTRQRQEGLLPALPIESLSTTVILMIAVGIHEEVIFRGLLLPLLIRVWGKPVMAVVVTALVFGVLHIPGQGLLGGIQTTLLGVGFGVAFLLTRSLIAVIVAHAAFNTLQVMLVRTLKEMGAFELPPPA